jgi:hypothetical protein
MAELFLHSLLLMVGRYRRHDRVAETLSPAHVHLYGSGVNLLALFCR